MLTQNRILREVATTTPGMRSFNQLLHLGQGISNWFESVAEESRSGPLTLLLQDDAGKPNQSAEQVPQRQKPGRVRWSLSQLVAGTEVTGDTARPGSESSPYVGLAGHLRCNVKSFYSFEHVEMYVCLPSPVLVQASPQSTCSKEVMRRNPSPDLSLPSRFKLLTHTQTHKAPCFVCLKPECGSLRGMIPSIWQVLRTNHWGDSGHQGLSDSFC